MKTSPLIYCWWTSNHSRYTLSIIPPPDLIPLFSFSYWGGTPNKNGRAMFILRHSWMPLWPILRSALKTSPPLSATTTSTDSRRNSGDWQKPRKLTRLVVSMPLVAEMLKMLGMQRPCSSGVGRVGGRGRCFLESSASSCWRRWGNGVGIEVIEPSEPKKVTNEELSSSLPSGWNPSGNHLVDLRRAFCA